MPSFEKDLGDRRIRQRIVIRSFPRPVEEEGGYKFRGGRVRLSSSVFKIVFYRLKG